MLIAILILQIQKTLSSTCKFTQTNSQVSYTTGGFEVTFTAPANISYAIISTSQYWDVSGTAIQGTGYSCSSCTSQGTSPNSYKCSGLISSQSYTFTCSSINIPTQFLIPEGNINVYFYDSSGVSLNEECTYQKIGGFLGGSGISTVATNTFLQTTVNTKQSITMQIVYQSSNVPKTSDTITISLTGATSSIATLDYYSTGGTNYSNGGSTGGGGTSIVLNLTGDFSTGLANSFQFYLTTTQYSGYVSLNVVTTDSSSNQRNSLNTSIVITPGIITISTITVLNMIYSVNSIYSITLTLGNSLTLIDGYLIIPVPTGLTYQSCSTASYYQCAPSGSNIKLTVTTTSYYTSGASITFDITFTNPTSTYSSIIFKGIQSYYTSSTSYILDQQSIKKTVTGFNNGILASVTYTIDNYKVAGTSGITFVFTTKNYIPQTSSIITITIPSQVTFISGGSCSISFSPTVSGTNSCTFTYSTGVVTLTLGSNVPPSTQVTLTLASSIRNPYSTTPNTNTGLSLAISSNSIAYDQLTSIGLYPTMTINSYLKLSYSGRIPTINGQSTQLTLSIQFETYQPIGSLLSITLPYFTFGTITSTFNSNSVSTSNSGNIITLTLPEISDTTLTYTIIISGLKNPDSKIQIPISAITYAGTYTISSTSATGGSTDTISDSTAGPITASMTLNNSELGELDTYQFTLGLTNNLTDSASILITVPTAIGTASSNCYSYLSTTDFSAQTCQLSSQIITVAQTASTTSKSTIQLTFTNYFTNPETNGTFAFSISTQRNTTEMDTVGSSVQSLLFTPACSNFEFLCKKCTSDLKTCIECYQSPISALNFLLSNVCVSSCGNYYYSDSNNVCQSCTSNCITCTSTSTACTQCNIGYEISNLICSEQCKETQFKYNGICTDCSPDCYSCSDSAVKCTACSGSLLLYSNKCVDKCPEGVTQVGLQCIECTSPCLTCTSAGPYTCQTCVTGYYYMESSFKCLSDCGNNYYESGTSCAICVSPCNNCTSQSICTDCVSNYYLFNGSCINYTPSGYYLSGSTLIKCPDTCGNCTSDTQCTSCPTSQYLLEYQCISKCPDKYYSTNYVCYACDSTCLLCTSSTICTSCPTGEYSLLGKCYTSCPNAYYISGTECLSCQTSCYTCTNGTQCDSCASTKYMQDYLCVASCSSNYYVSATQKCTQCSNECATCNSTGCLTCTTSYEYFNQTCLTSCPTGYKDTNNTGICTIWTDTDETVSSNLTDNKYIPVPFTIVMLVFILSVVVAKIQKSETFIPGSIVGLNGLLIVGSWVVLLLLQMDYILSKTETFLIIAALGVHLLLNLINLCCIKRCTKGDSAFEIWYQAKRANSASFFILNFLSLITFSFTRLYFSRYFGFRFLKCKLINLEETSPLNVINGLCVLFSCIPALIASVLLAYRDTLREQLFISSIDAFIVTILFAICLIWETQKEDTYFEDANYASLSQSHQVIPEFFQSKQNSKRFSFEDPTNMSKLNMQDEEPSFPKIDESAENQEFDLSNILPQKQLTKQNSSQFTFKKNMNLESQQNKLNSQDEIVLQIPHEKSEPLSIGESVREIEQPQNLEQQQKYTQEDIITFEEEQKKNDELLIEQQQQDEIQQQELKERQLLEQQQQQKLLEEQQKQQEEERKRIEEEQKQILLQEQLKEQEIQKKKIEEEEQAKRIQLEKIEREKQIEREQQIEKEKLIEAQRIEQELQKKLNEEKLAEEQRIEQEKAEQQKKQEEEKQMEAKQLEIKRIEEEQKQQEEMKQQEEKRKLEQILQEQLLQEQREKDMLKQLQDVQNQSQQDELQNEIEDLKLQVENLDNESKVNNNLILVDEDDEDVGWHMDGEIDNNQDINQSGLNIENIQNSNLVKDEQNEPDDDWDVPTSGFISVQQKSQLKKDNQIDEPTNPFQKVQQAVAANSDFFKQSQESDNDEDWAANQISPSDFNVLNQRFDNEKHSITQVEQEKKFSMTGQHFKPIQKRPTLPEPQVNSDNESYEQQSVFDQFAKNHVGNIVKKKQNKGLEKIYLQRLSQKQTKNTNPNYEDIQF